LVKTLSRAYYLCTALLLLAYGRKACSAVVAVNWFTESFDVVAEVVTRQFSGAVDFAFKQLEKLSAKALS
tara:strand:- start:196 stop:405 length:210 start_codon:yes stop_codon:yes gene_type:complete